MITDDDLVSILRANHLLGPERVREAREEARRGGKSLLEVVKEKRWLDEAEWAHLESLIARVPSPKTEPYPEGHPSWDPGTRVPGVSPEATVLDLRASGEATKPTALYADSAAPASRAADTPTTVPGAPTPLVRPSRAPSPAPVIGHYDIVREIGRGGMGIVYEALDRALGRRVALKVLSIQGRPDIAERFTREARSAARLQHAHILQVYEIGEHDGRPFMVLEFIEGESLAARIARFHRGDPAVTLTSLLESLRQAALGLQCAHESGVVHRDVKPQNILVDASGRAVLCDFGLARDDRPASDAEVRLTTDGTLIGTPGYLSPEQALGRPAGPASDVWSLGATLFEILTGRLPFHGGTLADILRRVASEDAPSPSSVSRLGVPPQLDTIARRALARDPARRFPSAAAFAEDLHRFLHDKPILARDLTPAPQPPAPPSSFPMPAFAIVALVVLVALLYAGRSHVKRLKAGEKKAAGVEAAGMTAEEKRRKALERVEEGDQRMRDGRDTLVSAVRGRTGNLEEAAASWRKEAEEARRLFEEATGIDAECALAHQRLGHARRMLGEDGARGAFDRAIAIEDSAAARAERATLLYAQAFEHLWPPLLCFVEAVGNRYPPPTSIDLKRLADEARLDVEAAVRLGARGPILEMLRAADDLSTRESHKAWVALTKVQPDAGLDPDFQYFLALAAFFAGARQESLAAFDRLVLVQPKRLRSHLQRALPSLSTDPYFAEGCARAAWRLAPDDPRTRIVLADAMVRYKKEKAAEALELIEPALDSAWRMQALAVSARIRVLLKQSAEAIEAARRAYEAGGREPSYEFVLACVLIESGQKEEGQRMLEKFISGHPLHPLRDDAKKWRNR